MPENMPDHKKENMYVNRELSWLKFNERVLEEAARDSVPLCEGLSFLSIYQNNLDEFFMVRVGALTDQMQLDPESRDNKTGMRPQEQLHEIFKEVRRLNRRKEEIYEMLLSKLENEQIHFPDFDNLTEEQSRGLEALFDEKVRMFLSPGIVGKKQPFPFLRNREIYAVAVVRKKPDTGGKQEKENAEKSGKSEKKKKDKTGKPGKKKLAIISCGTSVVPRLITMPDEEGTCVLTESLILHCMDRVFPGYDIESKALIRLTRNADVNPDALYDDEQDYLEFMSSLMKQRKRMTPVRMELYGDLESSVVKKLCKEIKIEKDMVFRCKTPLELSFLRQIRDLLRENKDLFYPKQTPKKHRQFEKKRSVMEQIAEKDKILCFPFDSYRPVLRLLREAAADDSVVSIRITLYRVAKHSQVVEALVEAAENGKDVQVLVELKARFDEENNIEWSRRLEQAGCHVIYGLDHYKVHSKICLITRVKDGQTELFTQIGTGNYNERTAREYTDISFMTHRKEIGENAICFFRSLAFHETVSQSEELLIAPHCYRTKILAMIEKEMEEARAGRPAYIGVKINALTDIDIINKLAEASGAGVKIDMIVRGICCLLPGIKAKTENIRIISIVGRYLEHSRIYIFGTGERERMFIGSADFMTRNMVRRVELAVPITDDAIKDQIRYMFKMMINDNCQAWELCPDGMYRRVVRDGDMINAQEWFGRYDITGKQQETIVQE